MSRSTRTLIAAVLLVLAGFMAINNIVSAADIGTWLLPAILLVAGLVLAFYPDQTVVAPAAEETEPTSLAAAAPMPTLAAAAPKPVTPPPPAPEPVAPVKPETAAEAPAAPEVREVEPETKAAGKAESVPPAVVEMHPPTSAPVIDASAAAPGKPDDLTKIKGVGPKMQQALRAAGFDTYAKIAASDPAALTAAIEAAGMRLAPTIDTWPEQAKALMA